MRVLTVVLATRIDTGHAIDTETLPFIYQTCTFNHGVEAKKLHEINWCDRCPGSTGVVGVAGV